MKWVWLSQEIFQNNEKWKKIFMKHNFLPSCTSDKSLDSSETHSQMIEKQGEPLTSTASIEERIETLEKKLELVLSVLNIKPMLERSKKDSNDGEKERYFKALRLAAQGFKEPLKAIRKEMRMKAKIKQNGASCSSFQS